MNGAFEQIITKIEKENQIFSNKGKLDPLSYSPKNIIGRDKETEHLLRYFMGYKKGYVVPLVSIYGRSGSGKTTLVRYVCNELDDVEICFVNLRRARTIFGATNLILSKLGGEALKNQLGTNQGIEEINKAIKSLMQRNKKKLFILVLDEFDAMLFDRRGNPSDYVFKLVEMISSLRKEGCQSCIVTISNNVVSDYELDDRVKSRIGSSEVFFEPYSEDDVLQILQDRSCDAFYIKIDEQVLKYCAKVSSSEHGDARRAIDLLRTAAELASAKDEPLGSKHVDMATDELQKDRIEQVISSASPHLKYVLMALAMRTYGLKDPWHATSDTYKKYRKILPKDLRAVTYRRFSDYLKEIENSGLVVCRTTSKGRYGYNSEYKLLISPEIVGKNTFPQWWEKLKGVKESQDGMANPFGFGSKPLRKSGLSYNLNKLMDDEIWS